MTKRKAAPLKVTYKYDDLKSWVYQLRVVAAALEDGGQVLLAGQVKRVMLELVSDLPLSVFDPPLEQDPPA